MEEEYKEASWPEGWEEIHCQHTRQAQGKAGGDRARPGFSFLLFLCWIVCRSVLAKSCMRDAAGKQRGEDACFIANESANYLVAGQQTAADSSQSASSALAPPSLSPHLLLLSCLLDLL